MYFSLQQTLPLVSLVRCVLSVFGFFLLTRPITFGDSFGTGSVEASGRVFPVYPATRSLLIEKDNRRYALTCIRNYFEWLMGRQRGLGDLSFGGRLRFWKREGPQTGNRGSRKCFSPTNSALPVSRSPLLDRKVGRTFHD